jgi:glycerol-3-phosphate dehydrogenase
VQGDVIPGPLIFARPAGETTVVGTWYFKLGEPGDRLLPDEQGEILRVINGAFPGWRVTSDDIVDRQVGYLPYNKSNKTELLPIDHPMISESKKTSGLAGLWRVQTEKWTTVRALAEKLVTTVSRTEGIVAGPSRTHELLLCGAEAVTLTADQQKLFTELSDAQSSRLSTHYGGRVAQVLDHVLKNPDLAESLPFAQAMIKGEIPYVLENEFVRTPGDLLRRLSPDQAGATDSETVAYMSQLFDAMVKPHILAARQAPN